MNEPDAKAIGMKRLKMDIKIELTKPFIITEGISGTWFYHISKKNNFVRSLCGKPTMKTSLTFRSWGIKTHLNERYCEKCFGLALNEMW
uniref:Uncharacterized protein n=1 Tax=viral metagenome TaxID=1070528 RepID=A0A6H1ZKU7_9ZZZZ